MKSGLVFAVSALVAGIGLYSSDSQAWFERFNWSGCHVGTNNDHLNDGSNDSASTLSLSCPFPDRTGQQKHLVSTVSVYTYDGTSSQSVAATRCASFATAGGVTCGATTTTGAAFTGYKTLSPASYAGWASGSTNLPYLAITLPPTEFGSQSYLKGYYADGS